MKWQFHFLFPYPPSSEESLNSNYFFYMQTRGSLEIFHLPVFLDRHSQLRLANFDQLSFFRNICRFRILSFFGAIIIFLIYYNGQFLNLRSACRIDWLITCIELIYIGTVVITAEDVAVAHLWCILFNKITYIKVSIIMSHAQGNNFHKNKKRSKWVFCNACLYS